jgi:hypothetical protein
MGGGSKRGKKDHGKRRWIAPMKEMLLIEIDAGQGIIDIELKLDMRCGFCLLFLLSVIV